MLAQDMRPLPSEEEDRKRSALATELTTLHSSLRVEPFDDGFSYGCVLETDGSQCPVPYIDIGIRNGTVSFSYSADPKLAFREALRAIAIFERHGYTAYDPQTESLVSSSRGARRGESSFLATRDAVVRRMHERGETVVGFPTRKRVSPELLSGVILFVMLAIALLMVRHYYAGERSPEMTQRLRDAQEHLRRTKHSPPNTTMEPDARKSSARGSP